MTTPVYRWPWDKLAVANQGLTLDLKQALADPPTSDKFRAQILSNGRWRTTFSLPTNNYLDTARARGIQLAVNGYANRMKLPDFTRLNPAGSLAASMPELVANPLFANGITGWTLQNQDASSRITSLQKLKLVASGATAPQSSAPITVVANTNYVTRLFGEVGTAAGITLNIGSTAFASDIAASAAMSTDGYIELPFNSGAHTSLFVNWSSTGGAGIYSLVNMCSVCQCLRVSGAGQTGGLLVIQNGPVSAQGVLLAGDVFEVSNRLYEVLVDFDTNSSGAGTIEVAPILRSSPANNQAIIHNWPTIIALMKSPMSHNDAPGRFGAFNFEVIEDLSL